MDSSSPEAVQSNRFPIERLLARGVPIAAGQVRPRLERVHEGLVVGLVWGHCLTASWGASMRCQSPSLALLQG
ncbi:MAG: hypothetical protein F4Y87_02125 [Synechococcus sp. SB0665_bin_28]|uniref:Uncharacterized protein n=1 Tax=Synechococcus sp. SB0676_bin_10 TaxID=2604869 RepID=A0A6B1F2P4_9SYNE|nr:hypothetical protein [Cyanobacteria bacterium MAG IRC3_bin_20]MCY3653460.1 hypothetical protein [Cyanobacteria bacterium MAG IRC1_bin_28]MDE0647054.1 hypothetical protein [Cyanobacteria bacterium MAG IRC4_bin_6]MXX09443.1 hypothetical protein [Synechococcus sp. SB0667_bin_8]MXY19306.1 hypothetical protein [Synechococcus sp. SB0664_bin_36]MXY62245.1 hypothetical protein [Synechococcus sp. SB0665_bin_28]MYG37590.1 hypothetical protein [Synechococcus sp. SB0676_bin_10]MYG64837.1 hypothetical